MQHVLKFPFFFFIFITLRLYAYIPSEGNVTASYGLFLYKTNFSGNDQLPSSPWLGGVGFITDGDLNDQGSLEIALFHMNQIYYRNLNNRNLVEKTELVHISMGYRHWLTEKVSAGLSFYAAYSIGDYQTLHSDSNVDHEIDTSARDTTEYGLDSSLQTEIWANKENEAVTLDLRYSCSISNKENEKGDHYGAFLSYRRLIQEKKAPSESEKNPEDMIEPRFEKK
jgi:hypothetical protein